jgi:hypothetical protein
VTGAILDSSARGTGVPGNVRHLLNHLPARATFEQVLDTIDARHVPPVLTGTALTERIAYHRAPRRW